MSHSIRKSRKQFRTPLVRPGSGSIISLSLSNSISFGGGLNYSPHDVHQVTDEITASDTVVPSVTWYRTSQDSLNIVQQIIVTGGSHLPTVSDTLSIGQTVTSNFTVLEIIDTLSITDSVSSGYAIQIALTDTLGLTQTVRSDPYILSITDTLSMSDLARINTQTQSLSHSLNLTQTLGNIYSRSLTDSLILSDIVDAQGKVFEFLTIGQSIGLIRSIHIGITHSLRLSDIVYRNGTMYFSIGQNIHLEDLVNPRWTLTYPVTDTLSLVDTGSRTYPESITQSIVFTDHAGILPPSLIEFVQTVTANVAKGATHSLGLTQSVTIAQSSYLRVITDSLGLGHAVVVWTIKDTDIPPGTGGTAPPGDPSYTPPDDRYIRSGSLPAEPTIVPQNYVQLTWPYDTPSLNIQIRAPIFGDGDEIQANRVFKKSRSGVRHTYRHADWPKTRRLTWTIEALKSDQIGAIITFHTSSYGQEIGLLDFEGRTWKGFLAVENIRQDRRDCSYTLDMVFEGDLV